MRETCVVLCALAVTLAITTWQRSVDPKTVLGAAAEPGGLAVLGGVLLGVSAWDRRRGSPARRSALEPRAAAEQARTARGALRSAAGRVAAAQAPAIHERDEHPRTGHAVPIPPALRLGDREAVIKG